MDVPVVFWAVGLLGLALVAISLLLDDVVDGLGLAGGDLTAAVLGGAAAAFGIAGGSWAAATGGTASAVLVGLVAGGVLGTAALLLTRALTRGTTDRALTSRDLLGVEGVVLSTVRPGTYGQILLRVGGHPLKLAARAERELLPGTPVLVVESLSSTAVRVLPL
ncbi:MAG TPA: hypothetical protein VFR07_03115 [Mycobacteriales bacterium]|nr:hypothetical protein [Mycobacteriales bacterium]